MALTNPAHLGLQDIPLKTMHRAGEMLFDPGIQDHADQVELMAFYIRAMLKRVCRHANGMRDLLTALGGYHQNTFWWTLDLLIWSSTALPVVQNSDGTLSILRPPLVKAFRRYIIRCSELVGRVARRHGDPTLFRIRPWSIPPDVLVVWWQQNKPGLHLDEAWALPDDELTAILSNPSPKSLLEGI